MLSTNKSVGVVSRLTSLDGTQPGDTALELIEQLVLENSQRTRICIIIIGSFNVAAALAVVGSILFDAFSARQQVIPGRKRSHLRYRVTIHPAEVFSLVISVAVIFQGLIFIAVQSGGLQSIYVTGCRKTAEIVWPALWTVAYTLLVFGLETIIRSFRRTRFRTRGNWDTLICILTIKILVIATWVPSLLLPAKNHCLATLIWWTGHYALIGVVLGSSLCFVYILSAAIITIQLARTIKVDRDERIAATRIVYYLIIGAFILALTMPYFVQVLIAKVSLHISHMASIVINLSGLFNGLLYLILRTNSELLAIRPTDTPWPKNRRMRIFGPNDLSTSMHISSPVILDRRGNTQEPPSKHSTDMKLAKNSTKPCIQGIPVAYLGSAQIPPPLRIAPPPKPASQQVSAKSSYSVFPKRSSVQKPPWSTTPSRHDDESIQPPAPLFSQTHRRDFSNPSTETVHIGLRLSHTAPYNNSSSLASRELPTQSISSRSVRNQSPHPSSRQSTDATSVDLLVPRTQASKPVFKSQWATKRKAPPASKQQPNQLMKSLPPIPQIQEEVPSGLHLHPPGVGAYHALPNRGLCPANGWI